MSAQLASGNGVMFVCTKERDLVLNPSTFGQLQAEREQAQTQAANILTLPRNDNWSGNLPSNGKLITAAFCFYTIYK